MDKVADRTHSIRKIEALFAESPRQAYEQLQTLKSERHAEFLREAIAMLKQGAHSSFLQVLKQFCREDSSNLEQILFTSQLLSLDEAVELYRISNGQEGGQQSRLISSLKAELDKSDPGTSNPNLHRLVELASKLVEPTQLGGILDDLADHPDKKLRSKAALLSSRTKAYGPQPADLIKDLDPRVRANAMEAMWGRRDEEAIRLFRVARLDSTPRVQANGLMGLYRAGDISSIRGILKLLREESLNHQLAGIWLISSTADPRFQSTVLQELSNKSGRIKLALLRAAKKINERLQSLESLPPLQTSLVHFERTETGRVRIGFRAQKDKGKLLTDAELLATGLVVIDGELTVDQFHFESRGFGAPMDAIFLIPAQTQPDTEVSNPVTSGLEQAIRNKRPNDSWAIHSYLPTGSDASGDTPRIDFSKRPETLSNHLNRKDLRNSTSLSSGIELCLKAFPARGERKSLVIVVDPQEELPPTVPEPWQELCEKHSTFPYLILQRESDPASAQSWRDFCIQRRGLYCLQQEPSHLPEMLHRICDGLPAYFYLTYQLGRSLPNPDPLERVRLEIYTPSGRGSIAVDGTGKLLPEEPLQAVAIPAEG